MSRDSRAPLVHTTLFVFAIFGNDLGCATAEQPDIPEEDTTTGGALKGLGGNPTAGHTTAIAGTAASDRTGGAPATGGNASGGASSGGISSGGHASGGAGQAGRGGDDTGHAGATSGGSGGSGNGGSAGSGGQAGGANQPAMCDEATATVLGTMSSNVVVASNVCLKMTLPADQTWIKKITLQPADGMYPLPFSWSNCGTNSSGAFTANYANSVLSPVTPQCPILVKLGGNGSPINVQWWGG